MEPQQNDLESIIAPLKKVTPLSKYLAMALFFILPFLGGWIGYNLAPEKVVEVENVVIDSTQNPTESEVQNIVYTEYDSALQRNDIALTKRKIIATTSQYLLESYECQSPQTTASRTCFSLVRATDGSFVHQNLADTVISQGIFSVDDLRSLYSFEYVSQARNRIYFRTGVPESSACCGLVEYNIESNTFVDKRDVWYSLGSSLGFSNSGRFLVTTDSIGKKIMVRDLEKGEIIFEDVVSEGSFDAVRCFQGAFDEMIDIDVSFSDNDTQFTYQVFGSNLKTDDVCSFELLEERKVYLNSLL